MKVIYYSVGLSMEQKMSSRKSAKSRYFSAISARVR